MRRNEGIDALRMCSMFMVVRIIGCLDAMLLQQVKYRLFWLE